MVKYLHLSKEHVDCKIFSQAYNFLFILKKKKKKNPYEAYRLHTTAQCEALCLCLTSAIAPPNCRVLEHW